MQHILYIQLQLKDFGGISNRDSRWTRPENMISNGPFILDEWSINKVIKVRNNNYWNNKNLKLNGIHFSPLIMSLHLTDIIDLVKLIIYTQFRRKKLQSIKKNILDQFKLEKYFGTYYYRINTKLNL